MFNAKTGRYDGISTAYRMKLVPAFVVDPDKPMGIPDRSSEGRGKKPFDDTTAAMTKAVNTLVPHEVPLGSGELRFVDVICRRHCNRAAAALPSIISWGGVIAGMG